MSEYGEPWEVEKGCIACSKNIKRYAALKAQLDEAVELLKKECRRCSERLGGFMDGGDIIEGVCPKCDIRDFLTRMEG